MFRADGNVGITEVWYTPVPESDAGVQLDGPGVSRSGAVEAGVSFSVYFDVEPAAAPGSVQLFFGEFDPRARVLVGVPLESPFNEQTIQRSVAIAPVARRLWWMRGNSENTLELVTASLDGGPVDPVPLTFATGCRRTDGDDATPFVTGDGRLLLFSGMARDGQCNVVGGKTLYVSTVSSASGQSAPATAIADVDVLAADEVDPALSADGCRLYFSTNRDGERFRLYEARRR